MGFCNTLAILFLSLLNINNAFVTTSVIFITESLIFPLFIISRKHTRALFLSQQKKEKLVSETISPLPPNNKYLEILPGKNKFKLLFMILPLSLLEITSTLCSTSLREESLSSFDLTSKVLLIIFTTGLSKIILHYKYHKHHLVGVIILFFGVGIFVFLELLNVNNFKKNYNFFVMTMLYQVITALQECFEKYLMEKKICSSSYYCVL